MSTLLNFPSFCVFPSSSKNYLLLTTIKTRASAYIFDLQPFKTLNYSRSHNASHNALSHNHIMHYVERKIKGGVVIDE